MVLDEITYSFPNLVVKFGTMPSPCNDQGYILLIWFNYNPSMDK